jgi:hypothetical protein
MTQADQQEAGQQGEIFAPWLIFNLNINNI